MTFCNNVKILYAFFLKYRYRIPAVPVLLSFQYLPRSHLQVPFKLAFGTASDDAKRCRNINALQTVGIWNFNTLYVFDDVSTAAKLNRFWHLSEHFACFGCRIGDGNRLCTAKRRNKLVL